jgi:hypothetical protein
MEAEEVAPEGGFAAAAAAASAGTTPFDGGGAEFEWWSGPEQVTRSVDDPLFEVGDDHRSTVLAAGGGRGVTADNIDELRTFTEFVCSEGRCAAVFTSHTAFEAHYQAAHHNACASCPMVLPSTRLLTMHIQECHDTLFALLAERQPMYECLVEGCLTKLSSRRERKAHLIAVHGYPTDYTFAGLGKLQQQHRPGTTGGGGGGGQGLAAAGAASPTAAGGMPAVLRFGSPPGEDDAMLAEMVGGLEVDDGTNPPFATEDRRIPSSFSFGRGGRGRSGSSGGGGRARGGGRGGGREGRGTSDHKKGRQKGGGTKVCYHCQQQGHLKRDCPGAATAPTVNTADSGSGGTSTGMGGVGGGEMEH